MRSGSGAAEKWTRGSPWPQATIDAFQLTETRLEVLDTVSSVPIRGLQSSTFQLTVNTFHGTCCVVSAAKAIQVGMRSGRV